MEARILILLLSALQGIRHASLTLLEHRQTKSGTDFFWSGLKQGSLFDPYPFCNAWHSYGALTYTNVGLDFPAYLVAILIHIIGGGEGSCLEAVMTPRGEAVIILFTPLAWLLLAFSVKRIANGRLRKPFQNRWLIYLAGSFLLLVPFALLLLLGGTLSLLTGDFRNSPRFLGTGLWLAYWIFLATERMGLWRNQREPLDTVADER